MIQILAEETKQKKKCETKKKDNKNKEKKQSNPTKKKKNKSGNLVISFQCIFSIFELLCDTTKTSKLKSARTFFYSRTEKVKPEQKSQEQVLNLDLLCK